MLNDICRYLIQSNTTDGIIHRFEFVMQFSSGGGRSGEGASASANGCYWDSLLTALTLNWNQKKIRRQDIVNYVNDWEFYEIDFYLAFAGYLIVKGGTAKKANEVDGRSANFIFPHLASLKGSGAAAKNTRFLQELAGKVANLPSNVDGTSLRSGAIQEMAIHPTTDMFHVAVRSGHQQDLSINCRAFEYTWCLPSSTLVGGMALAGYSNSRRKCFTARLPFYSGMSFDDQNKLTNMMASLFQSDIEFGDAKQQLYHCLLATLLMSLQRMVSQHGVSSIIVKEVLGKAREFSISYEDLLNYGSLIRTDFIERNVAHIPILPAVSEVDDHFYYYFVCI